MKRRGPSNAVLLGVVLGVALLGALLPAVAAAQGDGLQRAIEAQRRVAAKLMATPGVVGTGVALNAGAAPAIRVYTAARESAGVPRSVDGVAVERVVTGLIIARACQDTGDPSDRCNRPVPIGVSVGHPLVTAGTIGARVKNAGGSVFALSNNHVLANSNAASVGDAALQPGAVDGGTDPADRIGTLAAWRTISFNASGCTGGAADPDCNTIDAAIASTTTSNLGVSTLPSGYGTPSASTVGASVGQSVRKCGRTTGCTTGTVAEVNVTVNVCYKPQGPFCAVGGTARFVNQIGISDGSFSAGGDSGSLIVTSNGLNPVGLLFAGGSTRTFANEIGRVLNNFGVSVDTSSTTPPDSIPPANPVGLTATGGDGQVSLDWANNTEADLAGYNVYRSTTSGSGYVKVNGALVTQSAFTNTGLTNGTQYFFVVRAVDTSNNESGNSNQASATPQSGPTVGAPTGLTASVRTQGAVKVDLAWSGGASSVAIQRMAPGSSQFGTVATVSNSGTYRDSIGRNSPSGTYTYRVCNAGTATCSNSATASVP
jgi:hypothetical protein